MSDTPQQPSSLDARFESVLADWLRARDEGRAIDPERLICSFPDLESRLREFFAGQALFDRLAPDLGPAPAAPPAEDCSRASFGDYELLEEIARGGMGVVYKARQVSLNRVVALKMILAGQLATAEAVKRFRREARAAANCDHPGIVPIYEVGEQAGRHYFTMKLIDGHDLSHDLAHFRRNPRAAAHLLAQVARAVQHAHDRGLLHRDLKPGNILLDASKRPHVTDFGLATQLRDRSSLSRTGQIVGTASYMSPEQACAQNRELTPATDIYSLGAILYEMLTGRPPFLGETVLETLRQVVEKDPIRPRVLNPAAARDLETICLKCMDRRPWCRYSTARELAEDLESYVEGRPIKARPVGPLERAWLWGRRRPALVGLASATLLVLVVAAAIASRSYDAYRVAKLREQEVQNQVQKEHDQLTGEVERSSADQDALDKDLSKLLADQQDERREAIKKERDREQAELRAARDRRLQDREQRLANQEGDAVVIGRYQADMRKAAKLAESEDYEALLRLLQVWEPLGKAHDYRRWEWHYLRAVAARSSLVRPHEADPKSDDEWYFSLPGHGQPVARLDWSPEGRRLAVYDSQGWLRVLDVVTGREAFALQVERADPRRPGALNSQVQRRPDAWSPDGKWIALAAADGAVKILDAATGKQAAELPKSGGPTSPQPSNPNGYRAVAWNPNGRRVAAGTLDGKVPIYDARTGKEVQSLTGHDGPVLAVAWSGNGRQLASGGADGKIIIHDVRAEREECTLKQDGAVVALAWRPDGRQIIASHAPANPKPALIQSDQGKSSLWDIGKREVVWSIPVTAYRSSEFTWSSDGRRLALRLFGSTEGYREQQLLDAVSGSVLYQVGRNSPGQAFADRELRQAVQLTMTFTARRAFVIDLPNGRVSRALVPWLSTEAGNIPNLKDESVERVAWSPDGTMMALSSTQGNLQIRHLPRAGQRSRTLVVPGVRGNASDATGISWDPDSLHFKIDTLSASLPLGVGDHRKASHQRPPSIQAPSQGVLALSPDGTRLAATLDDRSIQLWDVTMGKRTIRLVGHQRYLDSTFDFIKALWWSPNGKYLASFRERDGTLKVWDAASGAELFGRDLGRTASVALAWSPDERRLALSMRTSSNERDTSILDATTGRYSSRIASDVFSTVAWSPDGKRLACGQGAHSALEIWDAETAQKVDAVDRKTVRGSGFGLPLAWDPASKRVAWATSHDGGGIYDTQTRQVVRLEIGGGTAWTQLVWRPDGKQLAVASGGTVLVFDTASGVSVSTRRNHSIQSIAWRPDGLLIGGVELETRVVETPGPVKGSVIRGSVQEKVLQVTNTKTSETWPLEPLTEKPPPPVPPTPPTRHLVREGPGLQFWSPDKKRFAVLRFPPHGSDPKTPVLVFIHNAGGKVERQLVGEPELINVGLKPVVAWSPDSRFVAGGGNSVRVWNVATGKEMFRLSGHSGVVESIAWSSDGRIITRSQTRQPFRNAWELKVWDAAEGREIIDVRGLVAELTFNPALTACSFVLTSAAGHDRAIVLWDLTPAGRRGDVPRP
jgi:WD40 repeat protein/tRNA A-37 threonylcarbamoyl transferase component Bud32